MMTTQNTPVSYTQLDFSSYKESLKQHLKNQDRFKDYDFDGSNMSVLLDLLSYNTMNNAFYLNMVSREMYLDSAQLRDSVVSHAKELNYTPRSFRSSEAIVNIEIKTRKDVTSVLIQKGTSFTSRIGTRNFTFVVAENVVLGVSSTTANQNIFKAENLSLYEGEYIVESFVYDSNKRFILSNKNIDTTSITVLSLEDNGSSAINYSRSNSLFGVDVNSTVFFIQGAENEKYEIMFGDGVSGRVPSPNSTVVVEYRVCNGELPNSASVFKPNGTIDGQSDIVVELVERASGGAVSESIDSIKFNAPRHFTTQERAVTSEDYENLIRQNFPEVNSVSAYGGEVLSPPQYGKVFVAIDLKDFDGLPTTRKEEYFRFLKTRSPVSIDVLIQSPEYLYVEVYTEVKYNVNLTQLNIDDIKTLVISSILSYAENNINNFNKTLRFSRLTRNIDDSHFSVVSNNSKIRASKRITSQQLLTPTSIDFGFEITPKTLKSTEILYNRQVCTIEDDGNGIINVLSINSQIVETLGKIDYSKGTLTLNGILLSDSSSIVKLYCSPISQDLSSNKKTIINISEEDIIINVERVRE